MIRLFHITLFLIVFTAVRAQYFSIRQYRGELNVKLEVIDEKRLDKGIKILNDAVLIENEALEILSMMDDHEIMEGESSRFRKMIKKFLESSDKYREGHGLIYGVYHANCDLFGMEMKKLNHYASGMNKAKYYESKGERTWSRAGNIREVLPEADKPEWIQYKMHEALELEKLAIRDKGRALQIYQDFPVEYNYGWDNDVSLEELARFFNNPLIKLPPEEVFKKLPKEKKMEPEGGMVEFRVQIAAHTVQLTDGYIKTFYTGADTVREIREGTWFKYHIGSFDNFQDADELRVRCRVPRAFVVAYQNGKKLTIKQALAILQENQ